MRDAASPIAHLPHNLAFVYKEISYRLLVPGLDDSKGEEGRHDATPGAARPSDFRVAAKHLGANPNTTPRATTAIFYRPIIRLLMQLPC